MAIGVNKLFEMLSWNNDIETQRRGIEEAKNIRYLSIFLQPIEGKDIWENCARILANNKDEDLEPYLFSLFEWLQDANWPGFEIINDRVKSISPKLIGTAYSLSIKEAIKQKDEMWLTYLSELAYNKELYDYLSPKVKKVIKKYMKRKYKMNLNMNLRIGIILPKDVNEEILNEITRNNNIELIKFENKNLEEQLEQSEQFFQFSEHRTDTNSAIDINYMYPRNLNLACEEDAIKLIKVIKDILYRKEISKVGLLYFNGYTTSDKIKFEKLKKQVYDIKYLNNEFIMKIKDNRITYFST